MILTKASRKKINIKNIKQLVKNKKKVGNWEIKPVLSLFISLFSLFRFRLNDHIKENTAIFIIFRSNSEFYRYLTGFSPISSVFFPEMIT